MAIPESFGALLRAHRAARALTQVALAQRVGVARETIKDLESGRLRPPEDLLSRLGDALALTLEERSTFLRVARHGGPASEPAAWPLPAQVAEPPRLIGREQEIAALCRTLRQEGVRVLTLTGPPGIGKTCLALAAARLLHPFFAAGAVFVSLAAARDPAAVLPAIALALGMEAPPDPAALLGRLQESLRAQPLLLVLDNVEQVVAAAPQIAALLEGTPLHILATSREALHIYGEHEFPVPPLALPSLHDPLPPDRLADVPAVALFIERARAARYDFALTEATAAAVAAICVRLDGVPLAIELAAARSKILSPAAMLARLDQRLPLLTGGPRDLPLRQQTLRGALDWSYDLLTPAERALFRGVAVFAGGWTLAAAEAVCYDPAQGPDDLLEGLAALVEKNLVAQEPDAAGEPRFAMLEMIREYALAQTAAGEAAAAQARHSAYYLQLAAAAGIDPGDLRPDALAQEHENIRAAWRWAAAESERPVPPAVVER